MHTCDLVTYFVQSFELRVPEKDSFRQTISAIGVFEITKSYTDYDSDRFNHLKNQK